MFSITLKSFLSFLPYIETYKEKNDIFTIMKDLKGRIAEISEYLQDLMDSAVFPEVQKAVEKRDKDSLVDVCRKIRIPEIYIGVIVSALLSVAPRQKWPLPPW